MAITALPKINLVLRESLHVSKPTWWLEARFHFSFADYYDPSRNNFGCLRVMNDDLIKGGAGFGTHPHRDAEIFTYIVEGDLCHVDNMGNKKSLSRGGVQYLSAGTGITHSEMNGGASTARLIQTWLLPDRRGHVPQYGESPYEPEDRRNQLLQIISGTGAVPAWKDINSPTAIRLHQDANVFVSENSAGRSYDLSLGAGRQAYLICIEGSLQLNDNEQLRERDAARVVGDSSVPTALRLKSGDQGSHFMLVEMKKN